MTFQANNIGNTTISFGDIWLGDEEGNPLDPDLPLGTIIIDITERNQPVPEPATFMLLGIGLAGMSAVVLRRRKRADKLS